MIQKIFCVRDGKVEAYMRPFFVRSLGEAERSFFDLANDPDSQVSRHPEDFALYYLGTYDDGSGTFESLPPQHVVNAVDVKRQANPILDNSE